MNLDFVIAAFLTVVNVTTPILLAATGELVVEKSGVLNLGVEGMMLIGAIAGFAVTFTCSDPELADAHPWLVAAGPGSASSRRRSAGALASLLFGFMVLTLGANQVASGLALVDFRHRHLLADRHGLCRHRHPAVRPAVPGRARRAIRSAGWCSATARSSISRFFMVFAVGWFLNRTRAGLVLRAVGENDLSAHSIGYSVIGVRYLRRSRSAARWRGSPAPISRWSSRRCGPSG